MRREERVTVQGPVKEQQPDGMSHRGVSFFRLVPNPPPPLPKVFCAIRAISCSAGRGLTFFFCREVLVPEYCVPGPVFTLGRAQEMFSCVSCVSQRMILCIRCEPPGLWSPHLDTRHRTVGMPKFSPTRPLYIAAADVGLVAEGPGL